MLWLLEGWRGGRGHFDGDCAGLCGVGCLPETGRLVPGAYTVPAHRTGGGGMDR